jgi:hypothetical protein
MNKCKISINQLADFSDSTEAGKRRIIGQQLKPSKVKVPRYQMTKAKIRKSMERKGDLDPIFEGIQLLENRKPQTKWQLNDKSVSIEALRRFINVKVPIILKRLDYQVIKPKTKTLELKEVDIVVAPDVVIKGNFRGQTVIGGIKIHISKTKPFDFVKAQTVSSIICKYLKESVANKGDLVLPELCFCLEVFDERMVAAPATYEQIISKVKDLCDEVKLYWK